MAMNSRKGSVILLKGRILESSKPVKITAGALGIIGERANLWGISISWKSRAVLPGGFQHSPDGNIRRIRAEKCSQVIWGGFVKNREQQNHCERAVAR